MKRFVFLILSVTTFVSCNNDQPASNNPLNQSAALIQQFKPLIHGVWVKKDYIKKVKKSKSPLEAVERSKGITLMQIDTAKMSGDSISVSVIYNNHKGSKLSLKFEPGRNTTTIIFGNDELSYKLKNKDTTLIIYHYDSDSKETGTTQYIKALNNQPANGPGFAMNYMINKAILSGTYEGKDAAGRTIKATFSDDGKLSGMGIFKTYYIETDFVADPEHSHDEIIFNMNSKDQKSYSFIINKRTLSLYDDSEHIKSNKPSYILKRKR